MAVEKQALLKTFLRECKRTLFLMKKKRRLNKHLLNVLLVTISLEDRLEYTALYLPDTIRNISILLISLTDDDILNAFPIYAFL